MSVLLEGMMDQHWWCWWSPLRTEMTMHRPPAAWVVLAVGMDVVVAAVAAAGSGWGSGRLDGPDSGCSCESLSMMTVVLACKAARQSAILLNATAAGGAKDTCKRSYHYTKCKAKYLLVTFVFFALLWRGICYVCSWFVDWALLQRPGPSLPSSA